MSRNSSDGWPELVLASVSPRRAELLAVLGLDFRVVPSLFSEDHAERPAEPIGLVESLALGKAAEVAARMQKALVIGADTIVTLAAKILEKPRDEQEARDMLRMLSGRWHRVYTGVALVETDSGRSAIAHECTRVKFRPLAEDEIGAYAATGEPLDKAGAYGIQGRGAVLVERIEGCYTNVVGLPMARLAVMLREFGVAGPA